jgi:hypothetical protein
MPQRLAKPEFVPLACYAAASTKPNSEKQAA